MPDSSKKFLIIRLSSIGDIVHALPAAAALAKAHPDADIDWIVESQHASLLNNNPYVRRIVTIDTRSWRKDLAAWNTLSAIWGEVSKLRQEHYSAVIDFQGLYKSALIAWLSGANERIGFTESRLREPWAGVLYSSRVATQEWKHVIDLNLALLRPLGVRRPDQSLWQFPLPSSAEEEASVAQALDARGTSRFIIFNPGGGWQSKCWSPENYAGLIRELACKINDDILLTGSPAEEALIERIVRDSGTSRARYFPSTLMQFIALARRARLLVGGDTGPLHIAAALQTPLVAIFGPTDPARNGPFSPKDITLWNKSPVTYTRRASDAGYISGISIESVALAIKTRLESANG